MFHIIKWTQITSHSVIKLRHQFNSINITSIRWKRNTFHRRPVKILTDSGEDYQKHYLYEDRISSAEHEINLKHIKNKVEYFDEGIADDLSYDNRNGFNINKFNRNRNKFNNNNRDNESLSESLSVKSDYKTNMFSNIKRNNKQNFEEINTKNVENKERKNINQTKSMKPKITKELKPRIDGIPVYEKLGDDNREFTNLLSNMKMKKRREKLRSMLLEGKRLICDAIDANIKVKTIYFSKEENLVEIWNLNELVANGVQLKQVLYKDMKLFSELVTSPGILALCERPDNSQYYLSSLYNEHKLPLILIGDNIKDPGNLGTLIRCAAAVGVEKLILTKGCVDVWDSKVLRSGAGAHFRIPIICDIEWPLLFNHIPIDKPFDLFIAESNNELDNNPMNERHKSRSKTDIPLHTINTITKNVDLRTDKIILRDDSYDYSNSELINYRSSPIASNLYTEAKFFSLGIERPTILVIGGETHGLSDQSYKLAYDYIGRRIKIPLAFGVDSLNSAVAAAVILYEMKRQFNCKTTG